MRPPPPPEVQVITLVPTNVPIFEEWMGTLDGYVNAKIHAQVTGYLLTQNYAEGIGLARDRKWARIVVEKPIGYDLESARTLNAILAANFEESQIFRIDHYLGKETVQNILAFRFANPVFEPLWNRRYVDCVSITAVEAVGVEHRGGYYDHAGALRDMVQNHLMQLLCLVAMEPMVSFEADEIRNKKADFLHAVRPIHRDAVHQCVVRGQYGRGWVAGKKVPGYREEDGVWILQIVLPQTGLYFGALDFRTSPAPKPAWAPP